MPHRAPWCTATSGSAISSPTAARSPESSTGRRARLRGEPLRDIARFVVSYALYLDRHTGDGARVRGHRLRAGTWGAGVDYLLASGNWFSDVAQNFLTLQLGRLGVPPDRWRDVVIGGLAEIATTADDPDFAAHHLQILARSETWAGTAPADA